jgi:hypothetical protein
VNVTDVGESRVDGDATEQTLESAFAWEWRVMAVSSVWAMPGVLFGALARVCVPDGGPALWWLAGGGALGAILGGLLEADHLLE